MPALIVFLVAVSLAHAEPAPPPSADTLLAELAARAPTNLVIRAENLPDAPVTSLYGDLFDAPAGAPEQAAKAFLEKFGPVLGFPPGSELPKEMGLTAVATGDKGHLVSLTPARNKVPYPSGTVKVQVLTSGKVVAAIGRYRPMTNVEPGKLEAGDAVKRALSELAKEYPGGWLSSDGHFTEYFEDAPGGAIRHVYEMSLPTGAHHRSHRVLLGPGGEVLELGPGETAREAQGDVNVGYPTLQAAAVRVTLKDLVDTSGTFSFRSKFLYGEHLEPSGSPPLRAYSENGAYFYKPYTDQLIIKARQIYRPNSQFLETHVYHHLTVAREQAVAWGAREVDSHVLNFDVWMLPKNPPDRIDDNNAAFTSDDLHIRFSKYNDIYNHRHPAFDLSVIYHEYGHYVLWAVNRNYKTGGTKWNRYNAAAVTEGFGDFFSAQITKDPTEGKWFEGADAGRSTDGPETYCDVAPPYVKEKGEPPRDGGNKEVHYAGRAFSGLCTDLQKIVEPDKKFMPMLISALRWSRTPTTFRNVSEALLVMEMFEGGKKMGPMWQAMKDRGIWSIECPDPQPR